MNSSIKSTLIKICIAVAVLLVALGIYADAWLLEKFRKNQWSVPASVYARSMEVYEGLVASPADIIYELKLAGYKSSGSGKPGTYKLAGSSLIIGQRPFQFPDGLQQAATVEIGFDGAYIDKVRVNHERLPGYRLEPVRIGSIHPAKHEDRVLINIDDAPDYLSDALIATEDKRFYEHHGISPRGIARAFVANIKEGKVVEGGSTLTQQLVKNFFLSSERSYIRKLVEVILALMLEFRVEKDQILEAYMNEVYVAQDGKRAIHGFGLASEHFFQKDISRISLAEAALLVAMMKGPSYYNPYKHPQRAKERRDLVIDLLLEQQKITEIQAAKAKSEPVALAKSTEFKHYFPAYLDLVKRQLRRDYSRKSLENDGLRIFTNLDPVWQRRAQVRMADYIKRLERDYGGRAKGINGAVIITDFNTGDVLAVVGGVNNNVGDFNRALDAKRSIGSLIKPVTYLTALSQGYSLVSPISDEPYSLKTAEGEWAPRNFDGRSHGNVLLYKALANSYNIASVRLGMQVGLGKVIRNLQMLGLDRDLPELPAVLLGATELSPLDVAQVYNTIANKGFYTPLFAIRSVTDSSGNVLTRYPFTLDQRISPDLAYLIDFALQAVMHEGTGKSVMYHFPEKSRVAGKTGTTNDQRDSWFAGYDHSKLSVVWLGYDDNKPMPVTGGTGALPIWASILSENASPVGPLKVPKTVKYLWVDSKTGGLSGERCENAVFIPFVKGTEPNALAECTIKKKSLIHWFKSWFQ